jgi:dolichol-phosphate mannosyltransferase
VNSRITARLNLRFGFSLTDAFCGFKRYNMKRINPDNFTERGYAFPMEFWAYASVEGLSVAELAVSRIYTTDSRSFGEDLDRTRKRYHYYLQILHRSCKRFAAMQTL